MAVERPRKTLLEETRIATFLLRNHFLRTATWEGMADEQGRPTVRLLRVYQELADGGAGLIITGATTIVPGSTRLAEMMGIPDDTFSAANGPR